VGNRPVTAGGAVRLPIETPTPTAAFDPSGVPRALTTLNKLAADSPKVTCGNACLDLLPSPGSYNRGEFPTVHGSHDHRPARLLAVT
jgi:hypothetical protein